MVHMSRLEVAAYKHCWLERTPVSGSLSVARGCWGFHSDGARVMIAARSNLDRQQVPEALIALCLGVPQPAPASKPCLLCCLHACAAGRRRDSNSCGLTDGHCSFLTDSCCHGTTA